MTGTNEPQAAKWTSDSTLRCEACHWPVPFFFFCACRILVLTSGIYCSHMQPACVVKKESAFDATQALKTFTYVQIALIKLSLFFFGGAILVLQWIFHVRCAGLITVQFNWTFIGKPMSNFLRKKRLLAVPSSVPVCDCIFEKSWWINGIEYLSEDDGLLPKLLGLCLCKDAQCCLQHSRQIMWYVVLSLHYRCHLTSPRIHLSLCEKLYFGTQYKKKKKQQYRWGQGFLLAADWIMILI